MPKEIDLSTEPSVYVGTYRRYNEGDLHGAWLNLANFSDIDAFWEAVNELHAAEIAEHGDLEPMFQDWEGIPNHFINESHLCADVWDNWIDLDDDDRELLQVYLEHVSDTGTLEEARDAFRGKHDSEADWAESFLEEMGDLDSVPDHLRYHINFESYARDCRLGGEMTFVRVDGDVWAFRND